MRVLVNIVALFFICFCSAFYCADAAQVEDFILLGKARSSDAASQRLWKFILSETKLSERNAELHNIYEEDCRAVFYDLDDDGQQEIIGTHYATGARRLGYNIMYILKKDSSGVYQNIAYRIFFAPNSPIFVLKSKTKGFHDLRCYNSKSEMDSVFVFSKNIEMYVDKIHQKAAEKEFLERYF